MRFQRALRAQCRTYEPHELRATKESFMAHRSTFALASAALLLAACASAPVAYPDATLEGLFDAERAFARASTERGIRASFLEYFAADGVDFRPGPGARRGVSSPPPRTRRRISNCSRIPCASCARAATR